MSTYSDILVQNCTGQILADSAKIVGVVQSFSHKRNHDNTYAAKLFSGQCIATSPHCLSNHVKSLEGWSAYDCLGGIFVKMNLAFGDGEKQAQM